MMCSNTIFSVCKETQTAHMTHCLLLLNNTKLLNTALPTRSMQIGNLERSLRGQIFAAPCHLLIVPLLQPALSAPNALRCPNPH